LHRYCRAPRPPGIIKRGDAILLMKSSAAKADVEPNSNAAPMSLSRKQIQAGSKIDRIRNQVRVQQPTIGLVLAK
jgi:hypothetical protein